MNTEYKFLEEKITARGMDPEWVKKSIKEYYMNYSEMEFVNFVKEKGNFSKAALIGHANGSGIYKFEH